MNPLELKEQFVQFIEFGSVFDKETRSYLVSYLHARLTQTELPSEEHNQQYLHYLKSAFDRLFEKEELFEVAQLSESLQQEIIADVLKWIKKVDKKIREDNPFYQEKKSLETWAHRPTFLWKNNWPGLINFLNHTYAKEELDTSFYAARFKQHMPKAPKNANAQKQWDASPKKHELDIIVDDLLALWDALLTAKLLAFMKEVIEEEQNGFGDLLHAKVSEFKKLTELILPFSTEAGRYWDMSRGLWKDSSFNVLDKYHQLLENEDSIRELADLLGRMREAEIELEEEVITETIVRKEWVNDYQLKDELGGVHRSNDLNRIVPSEAAMLASAETELVFLQKYADQNLLSFQYQGKKLVTSDRVQFYTKQKEKLKEKGPFVLCIDTSGSMHGLPAQIAKVLAFAIMKMAAKENRKCYLISFSIGIKSMKLHDLADSMDQIVDFLSMSFDGGTDVTPALSEALRMLQTNDYREADVLMVSDFIMFDIPDDTLQRIRKEQNKETQFHSLTLSNRPNLEVLDAFDNYWQYDPDEKKVMRLILDDLKKVQAQRI